MDRQIGTVVGSLFLFAHLKAFIYKAFLSTTGDGFVIKKEKIEEQEN